MKTFAVIHDGDNWDAPENICELLGVDVVFYFGYDMALHVGKMAEADLKRVHELIHEVLDDSQQNTTQD